MDKVSNQPATRLDVIQLQEALDQRLMERQALAKTGKLFKSEFACDLSDLSLPVLFLFVCLQSELLVLVYCFLAARVQM